MAYTFQDFLDGKISVGFTNDKPDEVDEFLKRCEAEGIKWQSGVCATEARPMCGIAYRIVLENGKIAWESQSLYRFTVPYSQLDMGNGGIHELHISCRDGKTTHAVYKRNGKIIQRTKACCSPDDKFDFAKGAAVAISRLGGFLKEPGKPEATPDGKHIYRMSLADARAALDAGSIDLKVGDMIVSQHKVFGELSWTVIGRGIDAQRVGDSRQTATLHMTYIPDGMYMPFDTPCKDYRHGHNSWSKSSVRKWLNDDFLVGFPEADWGAMRFVEKTTLGNAREIETRTTADKLFLLSATEIGLNVDGTKREGPVYPFYEKPKNRMKISKPSEDQALYWLRTSYSIDAFNVRYINGNGLGCACHAANGYGVAAACVI